MLMRLFSAHEAQNKIRGEIGRQGEGSRAGVSKTVGMGLIRRPNK